MVAVKMQNEMEREERSALEEATAKKKIGRQKWILFSSGYSGCECCVSFVHVQKQIRDVFNMKE